VERPVADADLPSERRTRTSPASRSSPSGPHGSASASPTRKRRSISAEDESHCGPYRVRNRCRRNPDRRGCAASGQIAAPKKQVTSLTRQVKTLRDRNGDLATKLAAAQRERDDLRTQLTNVTSERNSLRTQLGTMTSERDGLRTQVNSLTTERNNLATERNGLRSQLTTVTGERDTARNQVTSLTGERDSLKTQLTTAQSGAKGRRQHDDAAADLERHPPDDAVEVQHASVVERLHVVQ
jgi:chromosome segregation ATPase